MFCSAVMEEKQRQILDRNRHLLLKNIILTDSFYHYLRRENVLPDTMIRDIQEGESREERNSILLETLRLRGCNSYRKFCQVLYMTGHHFLADLMYIEDTDIKILNADEMFSKFPQVFSMISDDVKNKLLRYMDAKIREKALHAAWLKSGPERSELLEAKKASFDIQKELHVKLDLKVKKIKSLQDELSVKYEEMKKKDTDLVAVIRETEEMRRLYKEDLATQTRFNVANNSSIIQLRERFDSFHERVKMLNMALRHFLQEEQLGDEDDADIMKLSLLERNIRQAIQIARANLEATSSSTVEKEAIISILKTSSRHKSQSMAEIVRTYVERQEKGKQKLSQEIGELLELIQGRRLAEASGGRQGKTDIKQIKCQVATLRVQVEHIKKKLDWKDNQITDLIQENNSLREATLREASAAGGSGGSMVPISKPSNTVTEHLPNIHASPKRKQSTPDSGKEMELTYRQFDRYMSEAKTPTTQPVRKRRGSLAEVNLEREQSPPLRLRSRVQFADKQQDGGSSTGRERVALTEMPRSSPKNTPRSDNFGNGDRAVSGKTASISSSRTDVSNEVSYRRDRRPSLTELITIFEHPPASVGEQYQQRRQELHSVREQ